jgi:hypothetical protein
MASPFRTVGIARMAANRRRMRASCGQDEAGVAGVTEPVKEISRSGTKIVVRPVRELV